jgi:acetolactate synthase-1/2/3 large subunit
MQKRRDMNLENNLRMTGAELLVDFLKTMNVSQVFCITGAGNLAIVDAITRDGSIELIFSHHEQAVVMEAQGYSRITGNPGVALVTTGGGVANAFTGTLSAHLDSVPVFLISGNESSYHCENWNDLRAYGVQGFDSVSAFAKITKKSLRISSESEIQTLLFSAWKSMIEGRKGPVLVDFPMDLQRKSYVKATTFLDSLAIKNEVGKKISKEIIKDLVREISESSSPLIYIGNGCRDPETISLFLKIIEKYEIPFSLSWSASDLVPNDHYLNVGHIGIYGDRAANIVLQKSDLLISVGARLAIPQIGYDKLDFARKASKWFVDIDKVECDKFSDLNWNLINSSSIDFLSVLQSEMPDNINKEAMKVWRLSIDRIWSALPRINQVGNLSFEDAIHSCRVIEYLNLNLQDDAIVVTDVGAGLLSGHYMFEAKEKQRLITSQGLGEMGFGLPGAIGAYFGAKSRQLVCLNTDGAIMFNLQELQLISHHKIPMKLFIFNNFGYSMIKFSQENLFGNRLSGSDLDSGISFPPFEKIADIFELDFLRISSEESMTEKLPGYLESDRPVLIEVIMSPNQKYFPRLATTKREDGSLISPPLEDLDPKIDLVLLEDLLGYKAHENSYKARGI